MKELQLLSKRYQDGEMNDFEYISRMCKAMPVLYGNSDVDMVRNAQELAECILNKRYATVLGGDQFANTGE